MEKSTINEKVVVITGAAGGLGLAIGRGFAQAGARVILTDIDTAAGEDTAEKQRQAGLQVHFLPLDVRDPAQSAALVPRLVEVYGRLDVWVNNASVNHKGPAEGLAISKWQQSLNVILSGAFYCAQAAGQQMLAQGSGVIVNIASVNGYQYIEGRLAPSVSTAGLIMLTEALGIEWAGRGVRVVGVSPVMELTDRVSKRNAESATTLEAYKRRTPMHRLGTVEEIAEAVLFLASDEASYITGETLRVDGGWVAYQFF